MTTDKYEIKARIMAKDIQPSAEALARKERSIVRLSQEGVPTIPHMPVIDDSQSARRRTKEEIAQRAIALCLVAVKGEGIEHSIIQNLVAHYGAAEFFTPEEKAFIEDRAPSEPDRVQFCWRYECYWVMLWTLGYIESLGRPDKLCDVPRAVEILRDRTTEEFFSGARLRDLPEILDEADLAYRYDWAAVEARLKELDPPTTLDGGVTKERLYALNWLIGYMEQEWDHITTDT